MVIVCQKCGVTGFSQDLVYCSQCHLSVEHRYCLDNPPKTKDKKVKWLCEQCIPSFSQPVSQQKLNSFPVKRNERRKRRFSRAAIISQNLKKLKGSIESLVSEAEAEAGVQLCDVNPSLPTSKPYEGNRNQYSCGVNIKGDPRLKKQRRRVILEDGSSSDEKATYVKTKQFRVDPDAIGVCKSQYSCGVNGDIDQEAKKQRRRLVLEDESSSSDEEKTYVQTKQFQVDPEAIASHRSQVSCGVNDNVDQEVKRHKRKLILADGSSSDEDIAYIKTKQFRVYPDDDGACLSRGSCSVNVDVDQEVKKQERGQILVDGSSLDEEIADVKTKEFQVHPDAIDAQVGISFKSPNSCSENDKTDENLKKQRRSILEDGSNSDEGITCVREKKFDQEVGYHNCVLAKPIISPAWWGYFGIGSQKFGVILAHISSTACSKIFKVVKLLHPLIRMEMLPRLKAWPKSFSVSPPSSENIALFFFSRSERDDKVFDELVHQIIDQDLALRAVIATAELYIYSSRQLPQQYWRFRGKYYLWGVFKGRNISAHKPSE